MSEPLQTIRRTFELQIGVFAGSGLDIAYENASFTPGAKPYLELQLLPAAPDDAMQGSRTYIERGVFQVSVMTDPGRGPGAGEDIAGRLRRHFARGRSFVLDDIETVVVGVPRQARGYPDKGKWRVPVSVSWEAQVVT